MTELLCINDHYSKSNLEFFEKWNVQYPLKDKLYTLRDVVRTLNGVGILVDEIRNPDVPVNGFTGVFWVEANFALKRFVTLDGEPLTISDILENLKAEKLNTGLELVTIGEDDYLNHD